MVVGGGLFTGLSSLGAVAFREESDPAAVRRPLRAAVVAGVGELGQPAAVVTIEPQIVAEDALVAISAVSPDHRRLAVRRELHRGNVDVVEELVEGKPRMVGGLCRSNGQNHKQG